MSHFNRSFIRLRTQSGFKNAYSFYHANGGRRVFPFTYKHYLKIERGGSLPRPAALTIMLALLRRTITAQEREEITRDYLRDLSGDADVYDKLFAPLLSSSGNSAPESALPRVLGRLTSNLTSAQFRAIVSSPAATGCFMLFCSVPDALPIDKIAELLGLPKAECLAAIKVLRKRRLAVARGQDRYACAISAERRCRFPTYLGFQSMYARLHKNCARFAGKHGESHHESWATIRLRPDALNRAIRGFDAVLDEATSHSQKMMPPGPETPIYYLEARARRLVVFPPADEAAGAKKLK